MPITQQLNEQPVSSQIENAPGDRTMARADIPFAQPEAGLAWFDAIEGGARTWTSALTSLVRMGASVAEAQAAVGGEVVAFWLRGFPVGAISTASVLREDQVLAGVQAERAADAAHRAVQDLERPVGAAIPIPD
jgi:hypothetical protein